MSALCARGLAQSSCQIRAVCVFLETGLGGPTRAKQLSLCRETDLVDAEVKYILAEVLILVKHRVLATSHGGVEANLTTRMLKEHKHIKMEKRNYLLPPC